MSNMKFTTENGNKIPRTFKPKWALIGVLVIVAVIVIINSFTIVSEGYVGVRFQLGRIVRNDLNPGLNLMIPFIENIEQVEMRNQIHVFQGDAYTRDTQRVNDLRVKLTYRYSREHLSYLIREVGIANVEDRYLVPHVQKIARDTIGRVAAEELVQARGDIQFEIQETLTEELSPFGIIVTAVAIENIAFEPEFEEAIQQKVIAEQDALRAEHVTDQRREEARQVIVAAEAEAERIEIEARAEALAIELIQEQIAQNPEYIEYLKIINWDGILPQVIGDGVNPFVVLSGGADAGGGGTAADED